MTTPIDRRRPLVRFLLLGLVLALVVGTGVAVVRGNSFALDERRVRIAAADEVLDAVLATPAGHGDRLGVVVLVHGDGPVDATSDGLYRPIWEELGRAGYASLSWSKAGVGASTGNWLDQSLSDRAAEVDAALDWVLEQPGIDPDRVGLWGASQGGWVVPGVAARRDDVAFAMLVSPAISWVRQGRYHLLAELDHEGATATERAAAIGVADDTLRLLDDGADYARYRAETIDPDPMDEDRWGFVVRNVDADATSDLAAMSGVPTLLVLADGDLNVDADETERVYRQLLGDDLQVRRFAGARHSLARTWVEDHDALGLLTAVVAPRQVFVPGYLTAQRDFLTGLSETS